MKNLRESDIKKACKGNVTLWELISQVCEVEVIIWRHFIQGPWVLIKSHVSCFCAQNLVRIKTIEWKVCFPFSKLVFAPILFTYKMFLMSLNLTHHIKVIIDPFLMSRMKAMRGVTAEGGLWLSFLAISSCCYKHNSDHKPHSRHSKVSWKKYKITRCPTATPSAFFLTPTSPESRYQIILLISIPRKTGIILHS